MYFFSHTLLQVAFCPQPKANMLITVWWRKSREKGHVLGIGKEPFAKNLLKK
jgi:hypothetical protein